MATTEPLTPLFLRFQVEAHGIKSIYQLSKLANVAHSDIYNFLNGKKPLSELARRRIADVLPNARGTLIPTEIKDDPAA